MRSNAEPALARFRAPGSQAVRERESVNVGRSFACLLVEKAGESGSLT